MTVEPGKGGQTLLTDMVEKIKKLGFLKRAFSTYIDKIINKY